MNPPLLERRLVFITGKGGTGKSVVAAATALFAAQIGKKVLVCEVDGRGDVTGYLDVPPVGFKEREVLPSLFVMAMDTEASLREYLKLQLRIPVVGRIGPLAKAFDFVATAAPGVKETLTVGKLCYEVRERHYDLVVVDAPATGHVVGHLAAAQALNDLVKVGLIRSQTDWMLDILSDPVQTGLLTVCTPEEMPVNETIELAERIRSETTVDLAGVVVNRVLPELFSQREEAVFEAMRTPALSGALSTAAGGDVTPVFDAARLAVTLRRSRAEHLTRLREAIDPTVPMLYLPYVFGRSFGVRSVRQLATAVGEELGY